MNSNVAYAFPRVEPDKAHDVGYVVPHADSGYAVPRRGYALNTAVERIASPVRRAAQALSVAQPGNLLHFPEEFFLAVGGDSERLAWRILGIWLAAVGSGQLQSETPLPDAIRWFCGRELASNFPRQVFDVAASHLKSIDTTGLSDLLPYVIDAHGPGSRLSVRRDPRTRAARTHKKANGVFYTPADVANLLVDRTLEQLDWKSQPAVLDLAVGSGVFLRSAFRRLRERQPLLSPVEVATTSLYGIDIDPIALDGCAFVLLHDILKSCAAAGRRPADIWYGLRNNLHQVDALTVDLHPQGMPGRITLGAIWPHLSQGADVIIGNPPYATIGHRDDNATLIKQFETFRPNPKPTADLYPMFVEQMVRLLKHDGCGALVVPLSISANTRQQFAACRSLIERQPGDWRFAHFDREPHALFGEDVKTRNTVILYARRGTKAEISSGPLYRWRGDSRGALFAGLSFTPVKDSIREGIPKLFGVAQAEAWGHLAQGSVTLSAAVQSVNPWTLKRVPHGCEEDVFIGPTAYNFLGVMRSTLLPINGDEQLSENPLIRLSCTNPSVAAAVYAILSSHIAFWWWHVNGDGFHVNTRTLLSLPVGESALTGSHQAGLADLGIRLWQERRSKPLRSVNRGRVSYSFNGTGNRDLRQKADAKLAASLGLKDSFVKTLPEFVDAIVGARLHALNPFLTGEL